MSENKMNNKEIITTAIDALGIKNVSAFSRKLGYNSPSYIIRLMGNPFKKEMPRLLKQKIRTQYPQVNSSYLQGEGGEIINMNNKRLKEDKLFDALEDKDISEVIMLGIWKTLKEIKEELKQINKSKSNENDK
jgi:hypothetical protein